MGSLSQNDNISYFTSIPWCARLLSPSSSSSHTPLRILAPPSRTPKPLTGEDSLFARTLQTHGAIRAGLCFYPRLDDASPSGGHVKQGQQGQRNGGKAQQDKHKGEKRGGDGEQGITEMNLLFDLGDDLNGWPGVLHGGIVATLIDEAMGTLLFIDERRKRERSRRAAAAVAASARTSGGEEGQEGESEVVGAHTVDLRIGFRKPVVVPGIVLVRVKVVERTGRKIRLKAEIVQKKEGGVEEAEMDVCSTGEALFVVPRAVKL